MMLASLLSFFYSPGSDSASHMQGIQIMLTRPFSALQARPDLRNAGCFQKRQFPISGSPWCSLLTLSAGRLIRYSPC
jgi:hypothetical protein